jgi:HAD superfamily hydrolase (TIGR01549 family)
VEVDRTDAVNHETGMKRLKAIVLDFDGVIVQSVGIKEQAFEKLFKGYAQYDKIIRFCHSHNDLIRFEKFKYVFQEILGKKYTARIHRELSREFSKVVVQQVIDCPAVAGAEEFLKYFKKNNTALYLATMNPRKEIIRILKARKLFKYFKRIYSWPWRKMDAIEDILKKNRLKRPQMVFIGDSLEDFKAAQQARVAFIGCQSNKPLAQLSVPVFSNMKAIKKHLSYDH